MRFAIVDDIADERKTISEMLTRFAGEKNLQADIEAFESGESFLMSFRPGYYDIVFLDIYMEGMTGIKTAEKIREQDNRSMIIFLTTSGEHMGDAFSIHAFDYVKKPIDEKRFFACLKDAFRLIPAVNDSLEVEWEGVGVRVFMKDICMISSSGHSVRVECTGNRDYLTKGPFSRFSGILLQKSNFLLTSRGVIVNMDHIVEFSRQSCTLKGGITAPITVRNRKKLIRAWHDYEFEKLHREADERRNRKS